MDLLDFAISPALTELVSIIQASTLNQHLFRGIQLSDIFLLGEFLICRDQTSYKFIEDMLLSKLKEIKFHPLDNLILQRMTKNTQISKVAILDEEMKGTCSIAYAAFNGAIEYSLDPQNRLFERFADRTYALGVQLVDTGLRRDDYGSVEISYQTSNGRLPLEDGQYFPIMLKNTQLSTFQNDEINQYIYLSQETDCKIEIGIYKTKCEYYMD